MECDAAVSGPEGFLLDVQLGKGGVALDHHGRRDVGGACAVAGVEDTAKGLWMWW